MIWAYLRRRLKLIVVLIAFAMIFAVVLWASNVPLDAVVYASILCIALGALVATFDFLLYLRMHKWLQDMQGRVSIGLSGLPRPRDQIDRDWLALLVELDEARWTQVQKYLEGKKATQDYYTLWTHQIKTPISAMNLLLQEDVTDQQAIAAELTKIEEYVDMALNYMRLEGEGSDFSFGRYALAPIIREQVRRYARLFILKDIQLEMGELEGEALTDRKWLGFCLGQLLSNAIKYTPSSGHVSIFVAKGPHIVVQDNGIGIRSEDLPRVFQRGYTGLTGRNDERSTGIGLYMTHRVLTSMGHDISIASEVGKGTRVVIDLTVHITQTE